MMEWENKLYQILLKEQEAEAVVDDWVERNIVGARRCSFFYVYTSPSMKNIKLKRHNVPLSKA